MSLNSGFHQVSTNKLTEDELRMIAEYKARGGKITRLPPANVAESETVRATNESIAKKRKEFREKRRKGNSKQN